MSFRSLAPLIALLAAGPRPHADEAAPTGQVQIPIEVYNRLVDAARDPSQTPRPAPAGYALGNARVTLTVPAASARATAEARAELVIEVLEDQWVLVPVLPAGTPVDSATVGGTPVQLVAGPSGLGWATNHKGSWTMVLTYRVEAQRSPGGFALPLPVPRAAAISLNATLPGSGLDVTVIPAAGTKVYPSGGATRIEATVPATTAVQISWRAPGGRGHAISRAHYRGQLVGDAIVWTGELGVDVFSDETATVSLLPRGAVLSTLAVDGKETAVLVERDRFATLVKGPGTHAVRLGFETPVVRRDGPPRVELRLPQVPISRFDVTLPGKKDLKVTPAANVTSRANAGTTVATVYVPLSDAVTLEWSEAVPQEARAEATANAEIYHALHAQESVLYVHARIRYEVTRGATSRIELLVPPGVQVNRIESASGVVADWRLAPAPPGRARVASVFLDRELTGELILDVHYDRSLKASGEELELPLLRAQGVQRQRGMVALLAGGDLTLDPKDETVGTRVGENQLPAFVRESIDKPVAHTFKYADEPPRLVVRARTPEPAVGRFEAQVDTLVSLGEVALTATTSVDVHVKSGHLRELQLSLPSDVNLLSLSGPSLRTQSAKPDGGTLLVEVAFTQEMEGDFRLDLTYERMLVDREAEGTSGASAGASPVEVPTPRVRSAEVELGRIAVEAVSAVEVRPADVAQLTALDVAELPQRLVLRTTHPILAAYKYLHAEPPPRLTLGLTRHRLAAVQEASIDRADCRTLYTRDGLQVTTVEFTVRNSRKQFLKVRLPRGASVWSAHVDGKAEKPAVSEGKDGDEVLVKILNSAAPFPVRLVYATPGPGIGRLGRIRGLLPQPDILMTHTRWDVYVPADMSYGSPSTNLDVVADGELVSRDAMGRQLARAEAGRAEPAALDSPRISVPATGVHYGFEKLYANQSGQTAWFALSYASPAGAAAGRVTSVLGALLFWLGLCLFFRLDPRLPTVPSAVSLGVAALGLVIVLALVATSHLGTLPAMLVSLVVMVGMGALHGLRMLELRTQRLGES
jgi:hypothetical protein